VKQPAVSSLRQGFKLLQAQETLVIFPEGNIFRGNQVNPLKPGLARLALQAKASQSSSDAPLDVKILPIHINYSHPLVPWRSRAEIRIGAPLSTADYDAPSVKQNARQLTQDLTDALKELAGNAAAPERVEYSLSMRS
jgi:1-acyl-sn-glycerol-3-phosphate acyltransferase